MHACMHAFVKGKGRDIRRLAADPFFRSWGAKARDRWARKEKVFLRSVCVRVRACACVRIGGWRLPEGWRGG